MSENLPAHYFNYPLSFGANLQKDGVQFSIVSRSATAVRLLLYSHPEDIEPDRIIEFDPEKHRWGNVWSVFVHGIKPGQLYLYQMDGPFQPETGERFDRNALLLDPYAKALYGNFTAIDKKNQTTENQTTENQTAENQTVKSRTTKTWTGKNLSSVLPPRCVVVDDLDFDWEDDLHLKRDLSETIIYELHVRGFTQSATSSAEKKGTYLGLIEKIPYLQSLGITAVELMPVHEFPENEPDGTFKERQNYWGYDPLVFMAPHRGYAFEKKTPGAHVREFKEMVKAFHQAGIEVILDVVFNHTCEGGEKGSTVCFKGIDNRTYYMLDERGEYRNYSGCGNTVNGNHPIVRQMIFDALRHWVHNYHIDGFRFDLASILSRDRSGKLVANTPLLEMIAEDPRLADTKIIAEAWDAAGAYQVGWFGSSRWAEWNGKYRDDVRRFWRGDSGLTGALATRISGSSDLYQVNGRHPFCSINFLTSHDGFTLNDLVSYNEKHNEENGEGNADGDNGNFSYNYGQEGPSNDPEIDKIRLRQMKNMLTTLLFSQGVPMLVAGDEFRRTQRGNNNAYCQNNEISWIDWSLLTKNRELFRFVQGLIQFRKEQPTLRQVHFLRGQPSVPGGLPDVSWYGAKGGSVQWNNGGEHSFCCLLGAHSPSFSNSFSNLNDFNQNLSQNKNFARHQTQTQNPNQNLPPKQTVSEHRDFVQGQNLFRTKNAGCHLLLMFHAGWTPETFYFPAVCLNPEYQWQTLIDTSAESPGDFYPEKNGPIPNLHQPLLFPPRTLRVLAAESR